MSKIEPAYESACTSRIAKDNSPEEKSSPSATIETDSKSKKEQNEDSADYIIPQTKKTTDDRPAPPRYLSKTFTPPNTASHFQEQRYRLPPPPPPMPQKYGSTESMAPILSGYPHHQYDSDSDYEKPEWKTWQKVGFLIGIFLVLTCSTCSFIVVMVQTRKIGGAIEASKCSSVGGVCLSTMAERCDGGVFLPKYCAGTNVIQCCLRSTKCSERGGSCMLTDANTCRAGYHFEKGYCPGGNDVVCCVQSSTCSVTGGKCLDTRVDKCSGGIIKTGICSGNSNIQCCFESDKCMARRGKCQDRTTTNCTGTYKRNICPGRNDIQCCTQI